MSARNNNQAPAIKAAAQLRLQVELAVRQFDRIDKYGCGLELRKQATEVMLLATLAWREPANRTEHLLALSRAIELFVLNLQLAQDLKAFAGTEQFVAVLLIAEDLGRQVGGWNRKHHAKGQNAATHAPSQCASILSAQAASTFEAQP